MTMIIGTIASSALKVTGAFNSIATVTAAGGETSLTFSSIPQTFKHLQIRGMARDTGAATQMGNIVMRFNGDTASNYAIHSYYTENGGTILNQGIATTNSVQMRGFSSYSSTAAFGTALMVDIFDYSNTAKKKTVRYFNGANTNSVTSPEQGLAIGSGNWQSTSGITSIVLIPNAFSGAFFTNSTFALYGIAG